METQDMDIPVRAGELYKQTWERYNALLNEAPTLTLRSFCKSASVNYHGMLKWTRRQGLSVKARKKARKKRVKEDAITLDRIPTFLQLLPPPVPATAANVLHQVSITFPDGVLLTLQECTFEGLLSLIDTYARRRSAREAECSR